MSLFVTSVYAEDIKVVITIHICKLHFVGPLYISKTRREFHIFALLPGTIVTAPVSTRLSSTDVTVAQ